MKRSMLLSLMLFVGCAKENTSVVKEYIPTPVVQTDEVQRVLDEENHYRAMMGQANLSGGLTCSTYINLSNSLTAFPTSLPSANATFKYVGVFNQENSSASTGLNVIPPALRTQSAYLQWYAIRCSGYIVVTDDDYYSFELTSDDASNLYIANVKVVDNDGNHSAVTKTGYKSLRRGVHAFRLDYMQGPAGNQALILKSGGVLVPANVFVR